MYKVGQLGLSGAYLTVTTTDGSSLHPGSVVYLDTHARRRVSYNNCYYYYPAGFYLITNDVVQSSTAYLARCTSSYTSMGNQLYNMGCSGFSSSTDMGMISTGGDYQCNIEAGTTTPEKATCTLLMNTSYYTEPYSMYCGTTAPVLYTASNFASGKFNLTSSSYSVSYGDVIYLASTYTSTASIYTTTFPAGYYRCALKTTIPTVAMFQYAEGYGSISVNGTYNHFTGTPGGSSGYLGYGYYLGTSL